MFEFGQMLGLDPHPCYEYIDRCSCVMCVLAKNAQVVENMKRYPEEMKKMGGRRNKAWIYLETKDKPERVMG